MFKQISWQCCCIKVDADCDFGDVVDVAEEVVADCDVISVVDVAEEVTADCDVVYLVDVAEEVAAYCDVIYVVDVAEKVAAYCNVNYVGDVVKELLSNTLLSSVDNKEFSPLKYVKKLYKFHIDTKVENLLGLDKHTNL